ncbi:MAG: TonB-dependent receptor [Gammaproteobacteria bacterium]|nr:TonB-dependent receptor [Gammaproteobacteria bacterium]
MLPALLMGLGPGLTGPAWAQDEAADKGAPVLEEVIITAQKREQTLQEVPLTITAFSGDFVEETGVQDIRDIQGLTPNLSIKSRGDTEASVFIRGIGSQAPGIGADPAVGIFIDGMVASRGTNATAAFFDVERVEVVKGPQGTLFGRNASAGAISIITAKPELDENYGSVMLGLGDEGQVRGRFIGNLAAGENWAFRLGANYSKRDGLYYNELTDQEMLNVDSKNFRLSALGLISDNWETRFLVEAIDSKSNDVIVLDDDAFAPVIRQNRAPAKQRLESTRVIWTNVWNVGETMDLTSITGYYDHDVNVTPFDVDQLEFDIMTFEEPQTNETLSQELRLNGSNGDLDWFVGGSYVKEDLTFRNDLRYEEGIVLDLLAGAGFLCEEPDLPECTYRSETPSGANNTKSYALYGDFTWRLSDLWALTAGARYTKDKKNMSYNNPPSGGILGVIDGQIFGPVTDGTLYASDSWSSFDPRLAVDFSATENTTIFASVAGGYKSGGLNRQASDYLPNMQVILPFDEEKVIAYEAGTKSSLLNGRASLNFSAFYNDYEDYQLETFVNLVPMVQNIGDIKSRGIELEGRMLVTENFEVAGTYAYLDSEVKRSSIAEVSVGSATPQSPKHSASAQAHYYIESGIGEWKLSGIWTYTDKFWFDIMNTLEQPSVNKLDLRAGLTSNSGRWMIAGFVDNATDEEYFAERYLLLDNANRRAPGRLWRVEFTLNF